MAQLIVRNFDEQLKAKLKARAGRHGRSTEDEVRHILRDAVEDEARLRPPLGSRLAARFAGIGLDEDIPELRGEPARPADLDICSCWIRMSCPPSCGWRLTPS